MEFTLRDLISSYFAVLLFIIVLMIPGYLVGHALNLFDFRNRTVVARYTIGIVLSNALIPISLYLSYYFFPAKFSLIALLVGAAIFIILQLKLFSRKDDLKSLSGTTEVAQYRKIALLMAGFWIIFSGILLVDIQFGNKQYFASVAYDYTTRIALIDAISRTGVPPVNPTYFPGRPELLTYLYFYWYILSSAIDQIGGILVNARQAMIAGVTWAGLSLMATIALYLRLRNKGTEKSHWNNAMLGFTLLIVSGLDFIPVILLSYLTRIYQGNIIFNGRIEGWNMPIMSWLNAITWVPNHLTAAIACITAMIVMIDAIDKNRKQQLIAGMISGFAFASSLGTSVWVTLLFALIWAIWTIMFLLLKDYRRIFWMMVLTGVTGVILSIPFITGLLGSSNSGGAAKLPVAFFVRMFTLDSFLPPLPSWAVYLFNLIFLIPNYFMELGMFLVLGWYWFRHRSLFGRQKYIFFLTETVLVATVTIVLTFVYSNIIQINDLGIRGWLLGQFILLIWAVDVIQNWLKGETPNLWSIYKSFLSHPRNGKLLQFIFVVGIMTTALESFTTRGWGFLVDSNIAGFPNEISPDLNLGARTYNARLAYEFINENLPYDAVIQNNPMPVLDRPSGLYGERQMVISDRTAYGVPLEKFKTLRDSVGIIFERKDLSWKQIDEICQKYQIDVIVMNDTDPVWDNLSILTSQRNPLYQNEFYAVFTCGDFTREMKE